MLTFIVLKVIGGVDAISAKFLRSRRNFSASFHLFLPNLFNMSLCPCVGLEG